MFNRKSNFEIKTSAQFDLMRAAGLVVADTLALLRESVTPGMTTHDLDESTRIDQLGGGEAVVPRLPRLSSRRLRVRQ